VIRVRLDIGHRIRNLAIIDPVIDKQLRGCDLARLNVGDVVHGRHAADRIP
jgi:hypothetical protein